MFRGGVAEREEQPAGALAAYEQAWLEGPLFQSSCIALSHTLKLAGDLSRARELAHACLTIDEKRDDPDPWTLFRSGLIDPPTARWLHEVAWP